MEFLLGGLAAAGGLATAAGLGYLYNQDLRNKRKVINMHFEDTDEFYYNLYQATRAGHKVKVKTNFKSLDDMPIRLKKLIQYGEGYY